eukprot:gene4276-biopygen3477
MSENEVAVIESFESNHEEADTKLIALVKAANVPVGDSVMIRSPSGDIDVMALFLGHDFAGIQILIDNGTGLSRKIINITSSTRDNDKRRALIAAHSTMEEILLSLKNLWKDPSALSLSKILELQQIEELFKKVISCKQGSEEEYTVTYLRDVNIMLSLVSAVRDCDVERHLQAEHEMVPLAFALDHENYACYVSY